MWPWCAGMTNIGAMFNDISKQASMPLPLSYRGTRATRLRSGWLSRPIIVPTALGRCLVTRGVVDACCLGIAWIFPSHLLPPDVGTETVMPLAAVESTDEVLAKAVVRMTR